MTGTLSNNRAMVDIDMTNTTTMTNDETLANDVLPSHPSSAASELSLTAIRHCQEQQQQQQFSAWVLLAATNIISIVALALDRNVRNGAETFAISTISITLIFSIASCVAHQVDFTRAAFVSGPVELGMSTFLFLLWCPGLAVIMNPSNTIAVGYTQIVNGNLYVGSWVSFMCLCWMQSKLWGHRYNYSLAGVVQEKFRTRQGKWQALSAASVVVLASSVRVFHAFNCHLGVMKAAPTCQDSRVAIAVAVVAAVIAIMVTILGCFLTPSILQIGEYVGSILMLAFWGVGLGFITFGEGPGHSIGNLFFATWTAFLLSGCITGDCFQEWRTISNLSTSEKLDQTELPEFSSTRPPVLATMNSNAVHPEVDNGDEREII